MVKNSFFWLLWLLPSGLLAFQGQSPEDTTKNTNHAFEIEAGMLGALSGELPFWMKFNNSQRLQDNYSNGYYQDVSYKGRAQVADGLAIKWQSEIVLSQTPKGIYGSVIQLNAGLETDFLIARAGTKEEFFGLNDSTLSIGNLVYGTNARPIPKVVLATNGWKKVPLTKGVVEFNAYLSHGWFGNERYQNSAYLHQKYLYLRTAFFKDKLQLAAGLHHNAQWAGTNANIETQQPAGFKNYVRIFYGSSGGEDALQTDQQNALGNHLGTQDISISYQFNGVKISNYWQFLWEDKSGLTPLNWRDGLVGVSLEIEKFKWLNKVVFEHVSTDHQDAYKVGRDGVPFVEPDNFMNNGVYRSGWTYHGQVVGSPMFIIENEDEQYGRTINNMVNAYQVAFAGGSQRFNYELRLNHFSNDGTIYNTLDRQIKISSVDLRTNWSINEKTSIGLWLNFQQADYIEADKMGALFTLTKKL